MVGKNNHSHAVAKRIKPNTIGAEIGVWKGDTSIQFLKAYPKELHLVDAWNLDAWFDDLPIQEQNLILEKYSTSLRIDPSRESLQYYYDNVYQSVKNRFALVSNVIIHRQDSKEWFKTIDKKFDWIYVDGDHSYKGCLNDLNECLTILQPNGIIFGDDYGNKKGVTQAVNEFVSTHKLKFENFEKNQFQINT